MKFGTDIEEDEEVNVKTEKVIGSEEEKCIYIKEEVGLHSEEEEEEEEDIETQEEVRMRIHCSIL